MAGQLKWMADPRNGQPLSLDPYSRWFRTHGEDFEFSNQEARESPQDFNYSAVVISWTDDIRIPQPPILFLDYPGLEVISYKPDPKRDQNIHLVFGAVKNSVLDSLMAKLRDFEKNPDRRRRMESMIFRLPLRARSVPRAPSPPPAPDWDRPEGIDPAKAVIVAAIDDAINIVHERFRLPGGGTRIDFAWHQDGRARETTDPPFGREWTRAEIDSAVEASGGDEDAALRSLQLIDFSRLGLNPLARRATHGTHVLDLAAGSDPRGKDAGELTNRRIIAVQIPTIVTEETSGALLGLCLLAAVQYILKRARTISESLKIAVPVVINFSYAIAGGPHNGRHFVERAFDAVIEDHRRRLTEAGVRGAEKAIVEVVMPAGNRHLARCHAVAKAGPGPRRTVLSLDWVIPAGDRSPNYLELWLPRAARNVRLSVVAPSARRPANVKLQPEQAQVLCDEDVSGPGRAQIVVAWAHYTRHVGGPFDFLKRRVLLAIAPTDIPGSDRRPSPAGTWEVTLRADIAAGEQLDAWIQRDEPPLGYRSRGQQSYFEDPLYERFDEKGDLKDEDNDHSTVQRRGSLSAIATSERFVVVGGYRFRNGYPAFYSASSGKGMRMPDAMAVVDTSRHLGGILAAGTRSGSRVAINGTSIAAPQVARWLADRLAGLSIKKRQDFEGTKEVKAQAKLDERLGGFQTATPDKLRGGGGRLIRRPDLDFRVRR